MEEAFVHVNVYVICDIYLEVRGIETMQMSESTA